MSSMFLSQPRIGPWDVCFSESVGKCNMSMTKFKIVEMNSMIIDELSTTSHLSTVFLYSFLIRPCIVIFQHDKPSTLQLLPLFRLNIMQLCILDFFNKYLALPHDSGSIMYTGASG